jgi:hypothetical protein
VLCIPQDKQDEINEEIPFMGDYYAGADITIVLSDEIHNLSDNYTTKMHKFFYDVKAGIEQIYYIDRDEYDDFYSKTDPNIYRDDNTWYDYGDENIILYNVRFDKWFDRVWTLQEAILSNKIILVDKNGYHIDISELSKIAHDYITLVGVKYGNWDDHLEILGNCIDKYRNGTYDLADVMYQTTRRECYKQQDKFYGILAILGYKDFVVDNYGRT